MPYIVVFDDDMGLCVPMTWRKSHPGALRPPGKAEPIAVFHDRKDAQRAIRMSRHLAQMESEQGVICDDDFMPRNRQQIKVIRLEFADLPWR